MYASMMIWMMIFGKTVVAAFLIAKRLVNTNTLVFVHRMQL